MSWRTIIKTRGVALDRFSRPPLWKQLLRRFVRVHHSERDEWLERPAHTTYNVAGWRLEIRDRGERWPLK